MVKEENRYHGNNLLSNWFCQISFLVTSTTNHHNETPLYNVQIYST